MRTALSAISKMPCINVLLGEDTEDCGCASCIAKAALKKATIPEVVIEILGGVAHLETKSAGVQVTIRDHDNKTETEDYSEDIYDEGDTV